ncbi:hypothetical protein D3C85_1538820 [compost metagenome]
MNTEAQNLRQLSGGNIFCPALGHVRKRLVHVEFKRTPDVRGTRFPAPLHVRHIGFKQLLETALPRLQLGLALRVFLLKTPTLLEGLQIGE